jgi:FKBP-type peptidyl-prolyl cis-trans isomerase FkpA/FKBP-type peptidyl-prolyl cis-trans isomerase FklB
MMDSWKNLLVVSTLWSGLSLYALQDSVVQAPVSPAKSTLPNLVVPVVSPAKGVPSGSPAAQSASSAADQKAREDCYIQTCAQMVIHSSAILDFGFNEQQKKQFVFGVETALNGGKPPTLKPEEMEGLQQFFEKQRENHIAEIKKRGEAFLAEKQKEPGIQKTASGLLYKIVTSGDSTRANLDSVVKLSYEVRSTDDEVLDSTYGNEESIYLGMLQSGFAEAIKLFGQGGEGVAYISSDLAYDDGSTLIFSFKINKITQSIFENEKPNEKEEPKVDTKTSSK